jgi:hypothetical protein
MDDKQKSIKKIFRDEIPYPLVKVQHETRERRVARELIEKLEALKKKLED